MTPLELGWVAGFLEGEGSFCIHTKSTRIFITAVQVQREPLERLKRYTGLGNLTAPRMRGGFGRQPVSSWNVYGRPAAELMRELRDHMSPIRQVQIDKALARFATRLTRSQVSHKSWATRYRLGTARAAALKSWATRRRLAAEGQTVIETA